MNINVAGISPTQFVQSICTRLCYASQRDNERLSYPLDALSEMRQLPHMARICLFGGSFDPVHTGHLHIADAARVECELDEVVFLPCRRSPHKLAATGATGEQRAEMLRLATQNAAWASVDTLELERPAPSYSWMTAEHFRDERPGDELFWLIGTDQWQVLDQWRSWERLAEIVTFIVYTRGDGELVQREEVSPVVIEGDHPASATAIRAALAAGAPPKWLDPEVGDYISRIGLYGPVAKD